MSLYTNLSYLNIKSCRNVNLFNYSENKIHTPSVSQYHIPAHMQDDRESLPLAPLLSHTPSTPLSSPSTPLSSPSTLSSPPSLPDPLSPSLPDPLSSSQLTVSSTPPPPSPSPPPPSLDSLPSPPSSPPQSSFSISSFLCNYYHSFCEQCQWVVCFSDPYNYVIASCIVIVLLIIVIDVLAVLLDTC